MSFSSRLADLIRSWRHLTDDLSPQGCSCETGWSDLGAWIFTCRACMEAGMRSLALEVRRQGSQLEVDWVAEPPTPPEARS